MKHEKEIKLLYYNIICYKYIFTISNSNGNNYKYLDYGNKK